MENFVTLKRDDGTHEINRRRAKSVSAQRELCCQARDALGDGHRLVELLFETADAREETREQLARALGMGGVTLARLRRGCRHPADLERRHLTAAAAYLGLPVAQVYLLADAMAPADFYAQNQLPEGLQAGWVAMSLDPEWCGFVPDRDEWTGLPDGVKTLLVTLYSEHAGRRFLPTMPVPAAA